MAGEETSSPTLIAQVPVLRPGRSLRARHRPAEVRARRERERRTDHTQLERQRPLPHPRHAARFPPYARAPLSSRERTETCAWPTPVERTETGAWPTQLERTDPWQPAVSEQQAPEHLALTFSLALGLGCALLVVLAALMLLLT